MPIDPNFKTSRPVIESKGSLKVWGPVESHTKLGIHGSIVAVDLDLCFGCLKCIDVCTVNVFEKIEAPNHPVSEVKVDPIREEDCFMCFVCELVCAVDAILVDRGGHQEDTLQALLDS
ncbi:MAG: ferredoxin family protein [Candidatus Helarchaeota archaeon]|nr:ferredoxin family protein [Candidatus Helarchaeota archaeon]